MTSSTTPAINLDPTSGPVGIPVDIIGTGFAHNIPVAIKFDGVPLDTDPATVTTNNNGEFTASVTIPDSLSGAHSITANLISKTFTVTSSTTPAFNLDPTSGPVGIPVDIMVLDFLLTLRLP